MGSFSFLNQTEEQVLIGTEEGKLILWQENKPDQLEFWQNGIVGIDGLTV